jgi:hypothetical protein
MPVFNRKDPSAGSGPRVASAMTSDRELLPKGAILGRDSAGKVLPNVYLGPRQLVIAALFALVALAGRSGKTQTDVFR